MHTYSTIDIMQCYISQKHSAVFVFDPTMQILNMGIKFLFYKCTQLHKQTDEITDTLFSFFDPLMQKRYKSVIEQETQFKNGG